MKRSRAEWFTFGLAISASTFATLILAALLNVTGDCFPDVPNCGESSRRASFVVLGVGVLWLAYLVIRFVRSPKKFR